jgi:hypothetical protein
LEKSEESEFQALSELDKINSIAENIKKDLDKVKKLI